MRNRVVISTFYLEIISCFVESCENKTEYSYRLRNCFYLTIVQLSSSRSGTLLSNVWALLLLRQLVVVSFVVFVGFFFT